MMKKMTCEIYDGYSIKFIFQLKHRMICKKKDQRTNIQDRVHYAVHGHTAAELIVERADAEQEHMGLTTWENCLL
jgi:hypothetical protein